MKYVKVLLLMLCLPIGGCGCNVGKGIEPNYPDVTGFTSHPFGYASNMENLSLYVLPNPRFEGFTDWLAETVEIVDAQGDVVHIERRIVYAGTDPYGGELYEDEIVFDDFPSPGWHTVRVKRREDIEISVLVGKGWLTTDEYLLAHFLAGVSRPGMWQFQVFDERSRSELPPNKNVLIFRYSEGVNVDAPFNEMVEVLDTAGRGIACEPELVQHFDENDIPVGMGPSTTGAGFALYCERSPVSAVRMLSQPVSDTGVPAAFPRVGEILDLENRVETSEGLTVWIAPEPWPLSPESSTDSLDEARGVRSINPGGCGAQTARGGHARMAGALLLVLALLWLRSSRERSLRR